MFLSLSTKSSFISWLVSVSGPNSLQPHSLVLRAVLTIRVVLRVTDNKFHVAHESIVEQKRLVPFHCPVIASCRALYSHYRT